MRFFCKKGLLVLDASNPNVPPDPFCVALVGALNG
jgi:hypothetical protein